MAKIQIEVPNEDAEPLKNINEPKYSLDDDFLIALASLEAFVKGEDELVIQIEDEAGPAAVRRAYLQSSLVLLSLLSDATGSTTPEIIEAIRYHHLEKISQN